MSDLLNPYSPPDANLDDSLLPSQLELASLGQRLGGALLDNLLVMVVLMAAIGLLLLAGGEDMMSDGALGYTAFAVALGAWFALNLYPLSTRGQTVGKILVGSQIVGMDDARIPSLWRTAGVRYAVVNLIASIPVLGGLFALVNALFVFREDRRCIHDLMAGTQVVVYRG